MKHSKEDLEKAREKVAEIYKDIKKLPIVNLPQVECSVDWGSPKRQGKRSGHMVMGSMSAMIKGETKYHTIFIGDQKRVVPVRFLKDEKKVLDTIKDLKTGTATRIHVTTAKFYIMELST